MHQIEKVNRAAPSSVVFVVTLAVAALGPADAEFSRVVFKIKAILDEVWVLLYKMMEFIWKRGQNIGKVLHV